jgi:RimJ/RimL family protein N-acetyltransferase
MLTAAPALETARLEMRAHRREDLADCLSMWSDPNVVRFIGGRAFTEEEVWGRLHRYAGHWALMGYGYWLIAEKGSQRFVGEVGFADFKRDIVPSFGGAPEAGWALASWAHGRGLATEALQAAAAWLDAELGRKRTVCMIDDKNTASVRVAAKLGFREWTRTTYKGSPTVLFERPV